MLNKISSSESLAHKVKITINQIFTQAIADRLITFNPVLTTKTQAPNKPKRAYLTPIQRDILLTILKNHRLYSLILLLLYTGMRMSEALSLTWEDIDLENGYVSVTKAAEYKNGRPILKDTKNCKHRIIPIADKHLLDVLAKRKELGKKHVFHG